MIDASNKPKRDWRCRLGFHWREPRDVVMASTKLMEFKLRLNTCVRCGITEKVDSRLLDQIHREAARCVQEETRPLIVYESLARFSPSEGQS